MRLVTIGNSDKGQAGAFISGEILNLSALKNLREPSLGNWIPDSVLAIIEGGPEGLAIVDRTIKTVQDAPDSVRDYLRERQLLTNAQTTPVRAPIPRPKIVLSTARAYLAHDEEMVRNGTFPAVPAAPQFPLGFIKNTNSIIGHGQPIVLPKAAPNMVDWETEVSFVIGRTCHNVSRDEALDYVVGHTIMNDVSARDWVQEFVTTRDGTNNGWGKQFRTFCPIGPCIATADEVPDPHDIDFSLSLNGKVMQQDNVKNSYFEIGDIIAYYSQWLTLQPGDIISRGNSAGVGYAQSPQVFLKSGDTIEMHASGIGRMRIPVISEEEGETNPWL